MRSLLLSIIFCLLALPLQAINYYVANAGNDGATGLIGAPWQTVAHAQATLTGDQSDNSLLFNKGDIWYEQFVVGAYGTSGHLFTIGSYGSGANPILDGSVETLGVAGDWSCSGGYCTKNIGATEPKVIWINGLKQGPGTGTANSLGDWTYSNPNIRIYAGGSNKPTDVYTSIYRGAKNVGINVTSKNYVRITSLEVRRFQLDGVPEYTSTKGGILLNTVTGGQVDSCTLTDNGTGITVYKSPSSSVYGNTITGSYCNLGAVAAGCAWGILVQSDSVLIHNNTINNQRVFYDSTTSNQGDGIVCAISDTTANAGCANVKIYNNTVSYPYGYGINVSDLDAFHAASALGIEIYQNTLTHGDQHTGDTDGISSGGVATDVSTAKGGLKIYRNYIDGYLNSGIQITNLWYNAQVYYNVIANCGGSAAGAGWGGIKVDSATPVYNNTVYNSYNDGISLNGDASTYQIKNNIIHTVNYSQAGHGRCIFVDYLVTPGDTTAVAAYNDCYNSANGVHGGAGTYTDGGGNITSNPLFVSSSDFHLQAGSPAINAAVGVGLTNDHYGCALNGAVDIGAIEKDGLCGSLIGGTFTGGKINQ